MNNKTSVGILVIVALIVGGYLLFRQSFIGKDMNQTSQTRQRKESTQSANVEVSSQCSVEVIPALTEGPYYKQNSPERTNLVEEGISGEKLTLTGFVFDQDCRPIANAWLDFWQADGEGNYDNQGFKLRGYQFTDSSGRYILETVVPGQYPGRTPHIHVKVRATENSPVITSQLFLPGVSQNQTDPIFNQALVMDVKDSRDGKVGTFNFVVNK